MFDWEKLIDLAEEVKNMKSTVGDEFIYRSVINRTYYGAFSNARLSLEMKYRLPTDRTIHGECITKYKSLSDSRGRVIANLLIGIKKVRDDADYNESTTTKDGYAYTIDLCDRLIADARQVCILLKACKI